MKIPVIPDSAPFSPAQRAWLNGFFAAMLTARDSGGTATVMSPATSSHSTVSVLEPPAVAPLPPEEFPWRDSSLSIDERVALASDRPLELKLMSAMAQLDCGSCGYLCQTYAEAVARGEEKDLTRCSPGGTPTAKTLKKLLAEHASNPAKTNSQNGHSQNGHGASRQTSNGSAPAAAVGIANGTATHAKGLLGTSKKNPLIARLISNDRLTELDAGKDTRHVVIDLGTSNLTYEPGDSLGILPENDPAMVERLLEALQHSGEQLITRGDEEPQSLRTLLLQQVVINKANIGLLEYFAQIGASDARRVIEEGLTADENPLLLASIADLITRFSIRIASIEAFAEKLSPLQPRLYSIASSQQAHPQQVHLTMGVAEYRAGEERRFGIASHYAGVRLQPGDSIRVFVHPSKFRLPADPSTPIIMIGPGTGIAPFRGFLQHRDRLKMPGKSWLFFGNQSREKDYLYQSELEDFVSRGVITRLSLAFSRDQLEKRYVQHEMLAHAAELWQWLAGGAVVYICGDAKRMAADVEKTLQQIIVEQGHLTADEAKKKLQEWLKSGRLKKDVY